MAEETKNETPAAETPAQDDAPEITASVETIEDLSNAQDVTTEKPAPMRRFPSLAKLEVCHYQRVRHVRQMPNIDEPVMGELEDSVYVRTPEGTVWEIRVPNGFIEAIHNVGAPPDAPGKPAEGAS